MQVMNEAGKRASFYRQIAANGSDYFRLSEAVDKVGLGSRKGNYAIWIFAQDANLLAQRILLRKRDNAIAVEHCNHGKFKVG